MNIPYDEKRYSALMSFSLCFRYTTAAEIIKETTFRKNRKAEDYWKKQADIKREDSLEYVQSIVPVSGKEQNFYTDLIKESRKRLDESGKSSEEINMLKLIDECEGINEFSGFYCYRNPTENPSLLSDEGFRALYSRNTCSTKIDDLLKDTDFSLYHKEIREFPDILLATYEFRLKECEKSSILPSLWKFSNKVTAASSILIEDAQTDIREIYGKQLILHSEIPDKVNFLRNRIKQEAKADKQAFKAEKKSSRKLIRITKAELASYIEQKWLVYPSKMKRKAAAAKKARKKTAKMELRKLKAEQKEEIERSREELDQKTSSKTLQEKEQRLLSEVKVLQSLLTYSSETVFEEQPLEDIEKIENPFFVYAEITREAATFNSKKTFNLITEAGDTAFSTSNMLYCIAGCSGLSSRNRISAANINLYKKTKIIAINNGLSAAVANIPASSDDFRKSYYRALSDSLELSIRNQQLQQDYDQTGKYIGRRWNKKLPKTRFLIVNTLIRIISFLFSLNDDYEGQRIEERNKIVNLMRYSYELSMKINLYDVPAEKQHSFYTAFMKGSKVEFILTTFNNHLDTIFGNFQEAMDNKETSLLNRIAILAVISAFCDAFSMVKDSFAPSEENTKYDTLIRWLAILLTIVMFYFVIRLYSELHSNKDEEEGEARLQHRKDWTRDAILVIAVAGMIASLVLNIF